MSEKLLMFRNRLTKVIRHLGKQARRMQISCYRVYDHDLPEFPFAIEFYGQNLYVAEYRRNHGMEEHEYEEWMDQSLKVISEVLEVPIERIFLKLRQRKAGRLGQYQKFDEQRHEFIVEEGGLKFIVNLSDYLDTGLFLDHRITRQMVRNECAGKRMLNLFAYTGSFSVYAAAGKASEVTTIDLSNTYLNWAKKNMELNEFTDADKYRYVHADVKQYLRTIENESMDMIVIDPPTFSNSKRMDDFLDIQRDHVEMINHCLRALSPGGIVYFSTNFRKFMLDHDRINSDDIKDITKATTPFDFSKLERWCFKIVKKA